MENKFNIRENNITEILSLLFTTPNISRIDISKSINLNKASVSEIINLLIEKEMVVETGTGNASTSGGRKPILLKLNDKAGLSLSIDLGINYVSYILTDINKNILSYNRYEKIVNKDTVIEIILSIIKSLDMYINDYIYGLIGVSLAIHGRVFEDIIQFTPYYDLDEIDLKKELFKVMPNIKFHLENEANLAAIGEIGHIVLIPNGKECPCGNKGCFEQYCSIPSLLESFNKKSEIKVKTLKELCNLYNSNNKNAIDSISNNIELMAIGITNIYNYFAPDNIFIHSEIIDYIPNYLNLINDKINSIFSKDVTLMPNKLDGKSNLFGGITRCTYDFFNNFPYLI